MKRFISIFVFILIGTVLAEGEEMKFVTVLSSPVGTFAQLETANPTRAVQSPVVNFGTSSVSTGRIELKGAAGYIEDLYLQSGTELGGNAGAYRLEQGMEVGSGGRITGGRLMANEVDFSGALEGKSEVKGSLYTDEISVAGAKAGSLTIAEEVELTASSGEEEALEWSDAYICDYEEKNISEGDQKLQVGKWMTVSECQEYIDTLGDCGDDYLHEFDAEAYVAAHPDKGLRCIDYVITDKYKGILDHSEHYAGPGCIYDPRYCRQDPAYSYPICDLVEKPQPAKIGKGCYGGDATQACNFLWNELNKKFKWSGDDGRLETHRDFEGSYLSVRCVGECPNVTGIVPGNEWLIRNKIPSYECYFPTKCRVVIIKEAPSAPSSKCKAGSPRYNSYLLKSKATTASSDSEEEETEE